MMGVPKNKATKMREVKKSKERGEREKSGENPPPHTHTHKEITKLQSLKEKKQLENKCK